jgi:hypothetical protein
MCGLVLKKGMNQFHESDEEILREFRHHCHNLWSGLQIEEANQYFLALSSSQFCWKLCSTILQSPNSLSHKDDISAEVFFSVKLLHHYIQSPCLSSENCYHTKQVIILLQTSLIMLDLV